MDMKTRSGPMPNSASENWGTAAPYRSESVELPVSGTRCIVGLLVVAAALVGCSKPDLKTTAPDSTQVVAAVGGSSITLERLQAELQRHGTPDKQDVLRLLVRRELLYAEAQRVGFDQRKDVQEAWHEFIIDRFADAQRKGLEEQPPPSAADVEAFYRDHLDQFRTPERLHAALIYFRELPNASPERHAALVALANDVRAETLAETTTNSGFGLLAAKYSDHRPSRNAGGDVGWFAMSGPSGAWSQEVLAAIRSLHDIGEVSPPVATSGGIYLVKLMARQPASAIPLEKVRSRVQYEMTRTRADLAETLFYSHLESNHPVRINSELLDKIPSPTAVAASKPPRLPSL